VAATASAAFSTSRTSAGKVSTCADGRSRNIASLARVQRLLLARDDCQGRAGSREMQGRLETDAARSAGDQDDLFL